MADITDITTKKKAKKPAVLEQTLTLKQIRDAFTAIQQLMGIVSTVKGGIQVRRIWRTLKPEAEAYQEALTALHEKYGEKDEDGNVIRPTPGSIKLADPDGFQADHKTLLAETCAVRLNPVKLSDLGNLEFVGIGWVIEGLMEAGLLELDVE